jgi:transposase-like protein
MQSPRNALEALAPLSADDDACVLLESLRWPRGPVCPHCRHTGAYALTPMPGSVCPVRRRVWKCRSCRRQFTVRIGTLFEDSHIPLSKWVMAVSILCAAREGISAKQLERALGISYKSAWSMCNRFRYAMTQPPLRRLLLRAPELDPGRRASAAHRRRPTAPSNRKEPAADPVDMQPTRVRNANQHPANRKSCRGRPPKTRIHRT